MEILLVGSNSSLGIVVGIALRLKAYICSLGVFLDLEQHLDVQVVSAARNAYYQLRMGTPAASLSGKQQSCHSYPCLGHIQPRLL